MMSTWLSIAPESPRRRESPQSPSLRLRIQPRWTRPLRYRVHRGWILGLRFGLWRLSPLLFGDIGVRARFAPPPPYLSPTVSQCAPCPPLPLPLPRSPFIRLSASLQADERGARPLSRPLPLRALRCPCRFGGRKRPPRCLLHALRSPSVPSAAPPCPPLPLRALRCPSVPSAAPPCPPLPLRPSQPSPLPLPCSPLALPDGARPRRRQNPAPKSSLGLRVLPPALRAHRCAGALCAPSSVFIAYGLRSPTLPMIR